MKNEKFDLTTDNTLLASLIAREKEHKINLLPKRYKDVNDLGVLYMTIPNNEMQIMFFNRKVTSSSFDVLEKATMKNYNVVGEDCLFVPFDDMKGIIPPMHMQVGKRIIGSLNFDVFRKRWAASVK